MWPAKSVYAAREELKIKKVLNFIEKVGALMLKMAKN
jgi:hypothetical protein